MWCGVVCTQCRKQTKKCIQCKECVVKMEWPLWNEREMISSRIEWKIVCMFSTLNACLVNNKLKKVCSFVYVHMLKHSLVSLRLATEVEKKTYNGKTCNQSQWHFEAGKQRKSHSKESFMWKINVCVSFSVLSCAVLHVSPRKCDPRIELGMKG